MEHTYSIYCDIYSMVDYGVQYILGVFGITSPCPLFPSHLQVFLSAGLIVAMLQFFVFPGVVKVLGITIWQRIGCLVGIPAFLVASGAQSLSWNNISLFVVSVASTALIYCCNAMVRALSSHYIFKPRYIGVCVCSNSIG